MTPGAAVMRKLDPDGRINFQGDSLSWLASWCWLLAGGFRSPDMGPKDAKGWSLLTMVTAEEWSKIG